MLASEKIQYTLNWNLKVASLIGFNIMSPNFKMNLMSFIVIFDIITYMIINIYDVKLFWGDLVRVCFCLVTWSFGYMGSIRIITFVKKNQELNKIWNHAYTILRKMERQMETEGLTYKYARYISFLAKAEHFGLWSAGAVSLLYPLIPYFLNGSKILPFGFVIPGLSDTEQPGYAINYIHHIIQVVFTVLGVGVAQGINLVLLLTGAFIIDVIIFKLKSLNKELLVSKTNDLLNVDISLLEIITLHQESLRYKYSFKFLSRIFFL